MRLELVELTRLFSRRGSDFAAVDCVNLTVEPGQFLAIVGRSGNGKSTLLHMITGLLKPTSGQVLVDGQNLGDLSASALAKLRNQKIGYVTQNLTLLANLTVLDNVILPAVIFGNSKNSVAGNSMIGNGGNGDAGKNVDSGKNSRKNTGNDQTSTTNEANKQDVAVKSVSGTGGIEAKTIGAEPTGTKAESKAGTGAELASEVDSNFAPEVESELKSRQRFEPAPASAQMSVEKTPEEIQDQTEKTPQSESPQYQQKNQQSGALKTTGSGLSQQELREKLRAAGIEDPDILDELLVGETVSPDTSNPLVARAMQLLQQLQIDNLAGSYPKELSGGELRRVAVARALINHPELVLADEPTGDLDETSTQLVMDLLRQAADQGTTVLMVTHDKDTLTFADKVLEMSAGKIA